MTTDDIVVIFGESANRNAMSGHNPPRTKRKAKKAQCCVQEDGHSPPSPQETAVSTFLNYVFALSDLFLLHQFPSSQRQMSPLGWSQLPFPVYFKFWDYVIFFPQTILFELGSAIMSGAGKVMAVGKTVKGYNPPQTHHMRHD
jgi:hypothetical protein